MLASSTDNQRRTEKPKRPLSAYNYFFQHERKKLLEKLPVRDKGKPKDSHGKIGFADLARTVSKKWKAADQAERAPFDALAEQDKKRYISEMEQWTRRYAIFEVGFSPLMPFNGAPPVQVMDLQRSFPPARDPVRASGTILVPRPDQVAAESALQAALQHNASMQGLRQQQIADAHLHPQSAQSSTGTMFYPDSAVESRVGTLTTMQDNDADEAADDVAKNGSIDYDRLQQQLGHDGVEFLIEVFVPQDHND